jgi:transposase
MGVRVRHSREYKLEAVRLLELGRKPASELALELGIRRNQLYKWKEQLGSKGEKAFRGAGRRPASEEREIKINGVRMDIISNQVPGLFARYRRP